MHGKKFGSRERTHKHNWREMAVLNDTPTIYLLIFCFGEAKAKISVAKSIVVDVILFSNEWTRTQLAMGMRVFYEFWVKNDEMTLYPNTVRFLLHPIYCSQNCVACWLCSVSMHIMKNVHHILNQFAWIYLHMHKKGTTPLYIRSSVLVSILLYTVYFILDDSILTWSSELFFFDNQMSQQFCLQPTAFYG